MAIKKQEFYEGAALYRLVRTNRVAELEYDAPFFRINDGILVHIKYCTTVRSPWGFTFLPEELQILRERAKDAVVHIGLVCGQDGVATVPFDELETLLPHSDEAVHVACYRAHREHYEVCGPLGSLPRKVAPSDWIGIVGD